MLKILKKIITSHVLIATMLFNTLVIYPDVSYASNTESSASQSAEDQAKTKDVVNNLNQQNNQTIERKDIESASLASTLTMISIGLLTSRLKSCKMTIDIGIAAAAGVAYIAGEALAFIAIKKNLEGFKREINSNATKEELDGQLASLKKLRDGYEKAKKNAETKIMLQTVAAAAFVAAAAAAGIMYMKNKTALAACTAALKSGSATCASMYASSCASGGACYQPFMSGAKAAIKNLTSKLGFAAKDEVPGPSMAKDTEGKADMSVMISQDSIQAANCPALNAANGACKGYYTVKETSAGVCPAALSLAEVERKIDNNNLHIDDLEKIFPGYWKNFYHIIFPKAHAFGALSVLGIAAGAAIKYVIATAKSIGTQIDMLLYNPRNRAMIWLALAGLTTAAKASTQGVVEELKGNIDFLNQIIAMLEANKNGFGQGDQSPGPVDPLQQNLDPLKSNQTIQVGEKPNPSLVPGAENISLETPLPCFTQETSGKCNSLEDSILGHASFSGLDTNTQNEIKKIAQTVSPLNGASSISGITLDKVRALANSSNSGTAAIDQVKKDLVEKYGMPSAAISDAEKIEKDFLDASEAELKNQSMNEGSMYASMMGIDPKSLTVISGEESNSLKKSIGDAFDPSVFNLGAGTKVKNPFDMLNGESHSDKTSEIEIEETASNTNSSEEGVDLMEFDINDINKDKGRNLFDVISDRYQKTGFNRLFPKKIEN